MAPDHKAEIEDYQHHSAINLSLDLFEVSGIYEDIQMCTYKGEIKLTPEKN